MSENWLELYLEIETLIKNHSEIKIEPSIIRIGETVHEEFYDLFWRVREAFIKETNQALLNKAEVLSQNYIQVEEEVIRLLGLDNIFLFPYVGKFLHNPKDEFIKELRDPFFDLLKGRIDIAIIEEEASKTLEFLFKKLYQQGYEIWIVLSLIKLLEAYNTFRVNADQFDDDDIYIHGGKIEMPVPKPEQHRMLSFRHNLNIGALVADQIIQSALNGKYFSFRPNIVVPKAMAINKSIKREWLLLPAETIINMGSNVVFVYIDEELEALSLIADSKSICRPDLIIECIGLIKLFNENSFTRIRKYTEDLRPRLGTFIISNEPLIEETFEYGVVDTVSGKTVWEDVPKKENDIHFLTVDFDQSKIQPIIDLFVPRLR